MELNIYQLMVLRTLITNGWPGELVDKLLERCGCSVEDWDTMRQKGLVWNLCGGRIEITHFGFQTYKEQKEGKYF